LVELGKKETYQEGTALTTEGKHVGHVRVLILGSVSISMEGKGVREAHQPGTFVGEQGVFGVCTWKSQDFTGKDAR